MSQSTDRFAPALNTIAELAAKDEFSGVVLIRERGVVLAHRAYGVATRRWNVPVTTATRFDTASITKLFTAVAVLQQVDAGTLRLDDRIHDHVNLSGTQIPEAVTVLQLLSHTSGIADDADEEAGESYAALWEDKPTYSVTETTDFLPQFVHKEPVFAPGTDCRYNNVGYVLLGMAVEQVTSRSFRDVVTQDVFARAGMEDSGFFDMRQAVPNVAEGWDPVHNDAGTRTGWQQNIFSFPPIGSPDGGAHSTAADLVKFLDAVESGTLLSATTTGQFFTAQALHHTMPEPSSPSSSHTLPSAHQLPSTHTLHYAYGLEIEHDAAGEIRSYYKDGINAGASGILRKYPRLDLTIAVLANSEDGAWEPIDLLDETAAALL